MMRHVIRFIVLATLSAGTAHALTPMPKPQPFPDFAPGAAAPFAGAWAITIPTMDVDIPDTRLATCNAPVRIEAADETNIFYLGRHGSQDDADAAMELQVLNGGALWEPIAGGPSFFAFWLSHDVFYLYDEVPQLEADWGMPYIYRRCLNGEG